MTLTALTLGWVKIRDGARIDEQYAVAYATAAGTAADNKLGIHAEAGAPDVCIGPSLHVQL